MRIVVGVKHAPDPAADPALGADGRVVRRRSDTMSELDASALAAAVQIVHGMRSGGEAAETVAVMMGPPDSLVTLRHAFAVGADEGVQVADPALAGSDVFATARVFAAVIRRLAADLPVDLVLLGAHSADGATALLPVVLGAELGYPVITHAESFEATGGVLTAQRSVLGLRERVIADLPAVVSVTDQVAFPRFPRGDAIVAARAKTFPTYDLAELSIEPGTVGVAAARQHVVTATPRPPRDGRVMTDDGSGGIALVDFLAERGVLR